MASRKTHTTSAAQLTELRTAWEKARALAARNPSIEHRDAAKAAWAALGAASPRMKTGGYASRAGQRQAAERRSQAAERRGRGHATVKKTPRQLDREIAAALAGQPSETGSAFYDFLLERFPSGDVPWSWVAKILKEHKVPLPLMIGLGKEEAEQYGIRQGKPADVHQLARFLGY